MYMRAGWPPCLGWLATTAGFLLALAAPATLNAQFLYSTNEDTITITGNTGLEGAVRIPDTINGLPVRCIGSSAFAYCKSMTSVTIPSGVTNIASGAFFDCTGLTKIVIPSGVIEIGEMAFAACAGLVEINMPSTVASIGASAFLECSGLSYVTIASGVRNIGDSAFAACTALQAILVDPLNPHFSSVDGVLFSKDGTTLISCPAGKMRTYVVPNGVKAIGSYAFQSCEGLTNVVLAPGVQSIGIGAFSACSGLTKVDLPESVTVIEQEAFASCPRLVSLVLPKHVTRIEDLTFSGCGSLLSMAIPEGVTSIGDYAFHGCASLKEISIPSTVTEIGTGVFGNCASLLAIVVDPRNPTFSSLDGVLFDKHQAVLVRWPARKAAAYAIPRSVKAIGSGAFQNSGALTNIVVSTGGILIGDYAFSGCLRLDRVCFEGDAPGSVGLDIWGSANHVTAYYLPGTKGWGGTLGGRPTALWVRPQPTVIGVGRQPNGFGFVISWVSNGSVQVEACKDLANPVWLAVGTNTLVEGWSQFVDPEWTDLAQRSYRIRSP